jgi:microcompartment protein CcmK/EutM
MRIARVIGKLTLSKSHPSLEHVRFVIATPLSWDALVGAESTPSEEVVAYDELSAGLDATIGLSEGREAANPFGARKTPIDAYCACLIDQIDCDPRNEEDVDNES